jgi:hypothetical protein
MRHNRNSGTFRSASAAALAAHLSHHTNTNTNTNNNTNDTLRSSSRSSSHTSLSSLADHDVISPSSSVSRLSFRPTSPQLTSFAELRGHTTTFNTVHSRQSSGVWNLPSTTNHSSSGATGGGGEGSGQNSRRHSRAPSMDGNHWNPSMGSHVTPATASTSTTSTTPLTEQLVALANGSGHSLASSSTIPLLGITSPSSDVRVLEATIHRLTDELHGTFSLVTKLSDKVVLLEHQLVEMARNQVGFAFFTSYSSAHVFAIHYDRLHFRHK